MDRYNMRLARYMDCGFHCIDPPRGVSMYTTVSHKNRAQARLLDVRFGSKADVNSVSLIVR